MSQERHDEDVIRFALVLKPGARSEEGRARTAMIASRLGLVETSRGVATIAFRVERVRFEAIFRATVHTMEAGLDELGSVARPGAVADSPPVVPDELADYVDAVSVEPPAVLLGPSEGVP